jgi:hypothetical protein
VRNVFDQYSLPENRVTHALLASLEADQRLLSRFLKWIGVKRPVGRIFVLQQSLPGEQTRIADRDETERQGLPDGWIHDFREWSVLIESKVSAKPSDDQISRHLSTARRRGFEDVTLLWLTVVPVGRRLASGVINRTWTEVYAWLVHQARTSEWARRAAHYFEVAEVQADMKAQLRQGTLTRFAGVSFNENNPYSYPQAKRLLGLLRDELVRRRKLVRVLGMNPRSPGRKAITGSSTRGVWDFVATQDSKSDKVFTQNLHLTLGISDERVDAYVTIPNAIRSRLRTVLLGREYADFHRTIANTTRKLDRALSKYPGGRPLITVVQRRFASQRSAARYDAVLRFDPRTAIRVGASRRERSVMYQPQWLVATEQALRHRRSNLQLQIGAEFPYAKASVTRSAKLIDAVADVWLACEPVVRVTRDPKKRGRKAKRSRA